MIQCRDLTVRYGSFKALDAIHLNISSTEVVAIVGPSGCGKSTLARAIAGLIKIDHGVIQKEGKVQMVFQDPFSSFDPFWPMSYAFNEAFLLQKDLTRIKKDEAIRVMLTDVGLPYDSMLRLPHEFSGGQRQRLAIARALLSNPSILILDEPTSALDVIIAKDLLMLLKRLQAKRPVTTILITHNLIQAQRFADRIIVMRDGKVTDDPVFIKNLFDAAQLTQVNL